MSANARLDGRVALVTGAAGGLGAHFCRVLLHEGARVVLAGRRLAALEETARTLDPQGTRTLPLALDVTDTPGLRAAVAEAASRFGGLDIVVNNAGVTSTRSCLEIEEEEWDTILDTNLKGCFFLAQAAAREMKARGRGGVIVNVASILGLRVAGHVLPYTVAKAGLVQMTKAMALELARHDIRVNALCPGYVETELNADFFASEAGTALVRRIPQRRLGRLEDLSAPLLMLCGEGAAYVTGAVLAVDGGHLVSSL